MDDEQQQQPPPPRKSRRQANLAPTHQLDDSIGRRNRSNTGRTNTNTGGSNTRRTNNGGSSTRPGGSNTRGTKSGRTNAGGSNSPQSRTTSGGSNTRGTNIGRTNAGGSNSPQTNSGASNRRRTTSGGSNTRRPNTGSNQSNATRAAPVDNNSPAQGQRRSQPHRQARGNQNAAAPTNSSSQSNATRDRQKGRVEDQRRRQPPRRSRGNQNAADAEQNQAHRDSLRNASNGAAAAASMQNGTTSGTVDSQRNGGNKNQRNRRGRNSNGSGEPNTSGSGRRNSSENDRRSSGRTSSGSNARQGRGGNSTGRGSGGTSNGRGRGGNDAGRGRGGNSTGRGSSGNNAARGRNSGGSRNQGSRNGGGTRDETSRVESPHAATQRQATTRTRRNLTAILSEQVQERRGSLRSATTNNMNEAAIAESPAVGIADGGSRHQQRRHGPSSRENSGQPRRKRANLRPRRNAAYAPAPAPGPNRKTSTAALSSSAGTHDDPIAPENVGHRPSLLEALGRVRRKHGILSTELDRLTVQQFVIELKEMPSVDDTWTSMEKDIETFIEWLKTVSGQLYTATNKSASDDETFIKWQLYTATNDPASYNDEPKTFGALILECLECTEFGMDITFDLYTAKVVLSTPTVLPYFNDQLRYYHDNTRKGGTLKILKAELLQEHQDINLTDDFTESMRQLFAYLPELTKAPAPTRFDFEKYRMPDGTIEKKRIVKERENYASAIRREYGINKTDWNSAKLLNLDESLLLKIFEHGKSLLQEACIGDESWQDAWNFEPFQRYNGYKSGFYFHLWKALLKSPELTEEQKKEIAKFNPFPRKNVLWSSHVRYVFSVFLGNWLTDLGGMCGTNGPNLTHRENISRFVLLRHELQSAECGGKPDDFDIQLLRSLGKSELLKASKCKIGLEMLMRPFEDETENFRRAVDPTPVGVSEVGLRLIPDHSTVFKAYCDVVLDAEGTIERRFKELRRKNNEISEEAAMEPLWMAIVMYALQKGYILYDGHPILVSALDNALKKALLFGASKCKRLCDEILTAHTNTTFMSIMNLLDNLNAGQEEALVAVFSGPDSSRVTFWRRSSSKRNAHYGSDDGYGDDTSEDGGPAYFGDDDQDMTIKQGAFAQLRVAPTQEQDRDAINCMTERHRWGNPNTLDPNRLLAMIIVQRFGRMFLWINRAVRSYRDWQNGFHEAATLIQTQVRRVLASIRDGRLRSFATLIQTLVRRVVASIRYHRLRSSATLVQTLVRRVLASRFVSRQRVAAALSHFREHVHELMTEQSRNEQRRLRFREYVLASLARRRSAENVIQSVIQSVFGRVMAEISAQEIHRRRAATLIQSHMREALDSMSYRRLRMAVIIVQQVVRQILATRHFQRVRSANILIQAQVRRLLAVVRLRQKYLIMQYLDPQLYAATIVHYERGRVVATSMAMHELMRRVIASMIHQRDEAENLNQRQLIVFPSGPALRVAPPQHRQPLIGPSSPAVRGPMDDPPSSSGDQKREQQTTPGANLHSPGLKQSSNDTDAKSPNSQPILWLDTDANSPDSRLNAAFPFSGVLSEFKKSK